MKTIKKWDILSQNEKQKILDKIMYFFESERDESIGVIQAEELMDVLMEEAFDPIYNKWVLDSQKLLSERFQDLQIDLDVLKN